MKDYIVKVMRSIGVGFVFLGLLSACGYRPSSQYINTIFDDNVYVEVLVDSAEPENAPFIKDDLNRMVYTRFKGKIVPKAEAKSQIIVRYNGSRFIPIAYENGYIVRYRADVRVHFDMLTKQGKLSKNIHAIVESDIQASSYFSSTLRTEAIRKGLEKALDQFLAYVSAKGVMVEAKEKQEKLN